MPLFHRICRERPSIFKTLFYGYNHICIMCLFDVININKEVLTIEKLKRKKKGLVETLGHNH
jgi:hypothetical protein